MLGTVSVMDVEIEDQDLVHAVGALQVTGRDRHVVEEAEAQGHAPLGMVSGRTAEGEAILDVSRHDAIGQRQGSARREAGHVAAPARDPDIGHVEERRAGPASLLRAGDVARVVHCLDPGRIRRHRVDAHQIAEPLAVPEPVDGGDETLAPFRVSAARIVIEGVVEKSRGHRSPRSCTRSSARYHRAFST